MSAPAPRVLVVDDEPQIRRFLGTALTANGYRVEEAANGRDALEAAAQLRPDLIVLDLGLPDIDGQEVIRRLREWSQTPIVVLSVREREEQKVAALDAGADDYVTKPFSIGELLARMRAALRHVAAADEPIITVGDLSVDLSRHLVTVRGERIALTVTEYDLLKALASRQGRVLTHQQALRQVWGPHALRETQYLRVYIRQLRRKIEPDPARPVYILTEPGVGYRLAAPDAAPR